MLERLTAFWQGRVLFIARGRELSRFLNELRKARIQVFRIRQIKSGLRAQVRIKDFVRIRGAARLTHTRIHIAAKYGLPFILARWRRRKGLIAGLGIILLGLSLLSQFVLSIGVSGNQKLEASLILEKAEELGLKIGIWHNSVDYNKLAQEMQEELPDAAWIGIEQSGTHVEVRVVEKKQPQIPVGAGNLVANRTGLVEEVMVIQGQAQVREGEMVRQGQVLISGLSQPPSLAQPQSSGAEGGIKKPKPDQDPAAKAYAMAAKGFVRGRVWYSGQATVPLTEDKTVETGKTAQGWGIKIGARVIMVTTPQSPFVQSSEEVTVSSLPAWRNWRFPVELITVKYKELQTVHIERTVEEARQAAETLARQDVEQKITAGARIVEEKVKVLPEESGGERIRVEVETYEDLAVYANS